VVTVRKLSALRYVLWREQRAVCSCCNSSPDYLLYFLSGGAVEGYVATVTTATGNDALLPVLRRLVTVVRPISWNNTGGNGK